MQAGAAAASCNSTTTLLVNTLGIMGGGILLLMGGGLGGGDCKGAVSGALARQLSEARAKVGRSTRERLGSGSGASDRSKHVPRRHRRIGCVTAAVRVSTAR
jgi:hypothetical protein